ncbi:DNA-3-methyladenine glycosylase [Rubrobacter tropicus]|uniref:DNA-3-methyladenine glycosylase n=1 Tax=Rubrobacter tropicus TaxID=2653851 RepID=UPI001A9D50B3|nr:DNA-3-methyladenine glycosylase [Rubrobacter tropicus]
MLDPLGGGPRPRRALPPHHGPDRRAGLLTDVLGRSFYDRDPRQVAVDLLGCVLTHETSEGAASGLIVETEAYRPEDPACHAYKGPTMRNRNIFAGPGVAYVYVSYGIHHLLNVVCEEEGVGSAVLIRALRPLDGVELMQARRGRPKDLCNGPGRLTQALGVHIYHDGQDLTNGSLNLAHGEEPEEIVATTRIGITRGVELPWRYLTLGEKDVSVPPKTISERGLRRERSRA